MFCTLQHATDPNWLEVVFLFMIYVLKKLCINQNRCHFPFHRKVKLISHKNPYISLLYFTKMQHLMDQIKEFFKNSFTMYLSFWYLYTEEDFSQLTLKLSRRNSNQRIKKIYRRSWIKLDSLIIIISCFGFQK